VSLVLDAGALVAIERGDRDLVALLKRERREGRVPFTHGAVVGQVWRGGHGRQARLAALVPALHVHAVDESLGRRAGQLLGLAGLTDVVDAALVMLTRDGDEIFTSDVGDIRQLAEVAGRHIEIVPV
jgi:hypothetical protein